MRQTPWGTLEELRARRPPPGSRGEEARRRQRELLFAAMVDCCERQGFAATGVADLLAASGLSRGTFYAHFDDRFACFAATEAELLRMGTDAIVGRLRDAGGLETRARAALEALTELIAAQPAAARTCLVDCYPAGEAGMAPMAAAIETVTALVRRVLEEELPGEAPMTRELARAIVAGLFKVIYNRVVNRAVDQLPELVPALRQWAVTCAGLPGPLRGSARQPNRDGVGRLPPFAALSPEQRMIRAFATVAAEQGFPAATVADVCAAASVSQTTFYRHFADRRDLLVAALESSGAQLLAAVLPSSRRAPDWRAAARVAAEGLCNFLACEPELARLRINEVYPAGEEAIAIRDRAETELLSEVLGPALAERPQLAPITLEATLGAITGLLYEALHAGGAARLPRVAPLLTYFMLAPLEGARAAHEAAAARPAESRALNASSAAGRAGSSRAGTRRAGARRGGGR